MMYDELYQFLIQHKQLDVPGVGTFLLQRKPAEADFINKCIYPPAYTVALQQGVSSPSKEIFAWLSAALNISDREAIVRFNDFAFDLKKQIAGGSEIKWSGVGTLVSGQGGEIKFSPLSAEARIEQPVPAKKMIREHAEHMIMVGEKERTSVEMTELLNKPAKKISYWWAYSMTVGILAMLFIGWYFSENGMKASSTANQQKLVPANTEATYSELH
ncbi:MAG: hypothetical protein ACHQEB_01740 [Chitinophagales bacterium]